jgi:hypothetical protein
VQMLIHGLPEFSAFLSETSFLPKQLPEAGFLSEKVFFTTAHQKLKKASPFQR